MIFVPNIPGIFVPLSPDSSFSEILYTIRTSRFEFGQEVLLRQKDGSKAMLFFPGERFHPLERAYFLEILFRLPVASGKLSSPFGRRADPFTGHPEFHYGIDLAATAGSEVQAARDGTVEEAGYHEVLGYYIILAHQGGFQTVYGHLDTIAVVLQQKVTSGMIIGSVGSTGRSTGPHLHFEIRRGGDVQNPVPLLPLRSKRN
ncbi:MAG: peptidoglycan DD-metalloendopeptidase family protein [Spirochaeta sp.]|nr:peptidoglycan DD-metalloendopeptidase family protein [Spirochaeta sp.]